MKYAHLVKLTVFSYEHENKDSIQDAFLRFFPFNPGDNGIALKKSIATGFNERNIGILEVMLDKNSLVDQFLEFLIGSLDESQRKLILEQAESRLDKNLDFFLRFDKESWINGKKLLLTDSGRCFHVKISIAAFPKKREVALNIAKNLFSGRLNK